ncbi:hypothetical protein LTR17_005571 [Elasticomyces elasticus]|nr:hypothetical protein LTR17_005571 [Elasticomyces elasticus]
MVAFSFLVPAVPLLNILLAVASPLTALGRDDNLLGAASPLTDLRSDLAERSMSQELRDRKLPDCNSDSYESWDDIADKPLFWGSMFIPAYPMTAGQLLIGFLDTGAEHYADDFISEQNNSDHRDWAARMLEEILPDFAQSDFDSQFNAVDKGGLYYLYKSMENFHSFAKAYKDKLDRAAFSTAQEVGDMAEWLALPDGEADEPLDIFGIVSGAASIGSLLSSANPAVAGAFDLVSGAADLLGNFQPKPEEKPDVGDEARATIDKMVASTIDALQDNISRLTESVFGKFGAIQSDIPQKMLRGDVVNPAVSVFGSGDWMRDHATEGLDASIAKQKDELKKSLVWQMARLFKRIYVVVRTDIPQDKCTEPNNAWDAEKSRCLDMLSWDGTAGGTLGGANDLNEIWNEYQLDKFATLRNAVDCWEGSGGKVGDVKPNDDWASTEIPYCFFGIEVLKGSYESEDMHGMLMLSGDFPGQENMEGKLWPMIKCDDSYQDCASEWNV